MKAIGLMPVLFIGHGSPMNALADNSFTKMLNELRHKVPLPKAILCISAHWMTEGSWLTHMERPKTIHDFYGFPQALFDVNYPAPGEPALAEKIQRLITEPAVQLDSEMWGLDHGTWSVLVHMYPRADIPVIQLSLYLEQPVEYHYKLAKELTKLRSEGFLIIGSGNIVHNLRLMKGEEEAKPHSWAIEFDEWIKLKLEERDFSSIINDSRKTEAGRLSIPTMEHFLPFIYTLGASMPGDDIRFEYEGIHNGSISMRCVSFGL